MTEEFILERFCDCDEQGVFGRLYHDGELICYTVEQPWRDNRPNVSCVPAGRYKLEAHHSEKYPDTFAMVNHGLGVYHYPADGWTAKDRYSCLIHTANYARQVSGCIGPGHKLFASSGEWMVTRSRLTMGLIRAIIEDIDDWYITIIWKDHS